jgi:hypothetical protein
MCRAGDNVSAAEGRGGSALALAGELESAKNALAVMGWTSLAERFARPL